MTDATTDEEETPAKGSKLPLILGIVLGLASAGGGFFAVSSGLILGGESTSTASESKEEPTISRAEVAFVPLDPLTIAMQHRDGEKFLRFRAELEVAPKYKSEVETTKPRIIDVLNGYLRAIELHDLQNPASLTRLRAQMLRRVQVVAGPDRVKDLLIMEFVVS